MNKQSVTSPEIINHRKSNQTIVQFFLKKVFYKLYYLFLEKKFKRNSYDKYLNKSWNTINFNRIALVNLLLKNYSNPNYLEIGCASNSLFDSLPISKKTGVDPCSGGNIRKTSDEFFKENKETFDVIFIDGLHTYKQIRNDIINSLNCINDNGWIAMHDMLPRDWKEQHIPILTTKAWTGDVWKVAFEIIKTEGLDFKIISIDCGVGVIKVNKKNAILRDLNSELADKQFQYYFENLNKLPILDWEESMKWINVNSNNKK